MKTVYYKAYFIFSKKVPKIVENIISREFLRLRHFAAEALNPHYKEWNSEFTGITTACTGANHTGRFPLVSSK